MSPLPSPTFLASEMVLSLHTRDFLNKWSQKDQEILRLGIRRSVDVLLGKQSPDGMMKRPLLGYWKGSLSRGLLPMASSFRQIRKLIMGLL